MSRVGEVRYLLKIANVCMFSYERDIEVATKAFNDLSYEIVGHLDVNGTQLYVLKSLSEIVIAFRGTEPSEIQDIITDADFKLVDDEQGKIHRGFKKAYEQVKEELLGIIFDHYEEQEVVFAGHSLGGALAKLCMLDIVKNLKIKDYKAVTFGAPKIGSAKFVKYFDNYFEGKVIRVVNDEDIVPMVPTLTFFQYRQCKGLKFIDDKCVVSDQHNIYPYFKNGLDLIFELIKAYSKTAPKNVKKVLIQNLIELGKDHKIEAYIDSLERAVKKLKIHKENKSERNAPRH